MLHPPTGQELELLGPFIKFVCFAEMVLALGQAWLDDRHAAIAALRSSHKHCQLTLSGLSAH